MKAKTNALNKVVKVMVFSDLFLNLGWGLIAPILAVFIVEGVPGGNIKVAGIAAGIYLLGRSFLQIPIANYLDKNHGEKDDYASLVLGTLLMAVAPLIFAFASLPWHIYLAQIIRAFGAAMALPSWSAIFTRHITKKREALCWSLDSSFIGFGAGVAGIVGGLLVSTYGFTPLFIAVAVLDIVAGLLLLLIAKDVLPKVPRMGIFPFPKF